MLFPDLPDIWEEEAITTQSSPIKFTAKPISEKLKPIKFSVKPSGEINFEGVPDDDIIRQIITTTDYHRDQDRSQKSEEKSQESEILKQARNVDMMTLGVLGSSILVSFMKKYKAEKIINTVKIKPINKKKKTSDIFSNSLVKLIFD